MHSVALSAIFSAIGICCVQLKARKSCQLSYSAPTPHATISFFPFRPYLRGGRWNANYGGFNFRPSCHFDNSRNDFQANPLLLSLPSLAFQLSIWITSTEMFLRGETNMLDHFSGDFPSKDNLLMGTPLAEPALAVRFSQNWPKLYCR